MHHLSVEPHIHTVVAHMYAWRQQIIIMLKFDEQKNLVQQEY